MSRQRMYSGDEARQLFEELYFTEPEIDLESDTSQDDSSSSGDSLTSERAANRNIDKELQTNARSDAGDQTDVDDHEPSWSDIPPNPNESEFKTDVAPQKIYLLKTHECHPGYEIQASEKGKDSSTGTITDHELDVPQSDCYYSEVYVPSPGDSADSPTITEFDVPQSDCYYSEVYVPPPGDSADSPTITELDVPQSDCYYSEVYVPSPGDPADSPTITELDVPQSDCYYSEVYIPSPAVSDNSSTITEFDVPFPAVRGRKRTRVHFIDSNSDSSCNGGVSSYTKKRRKNKASLELATILRMKCCQNYCLHKLSRKEVANSRNVFQEKSKSEQREWILLYLLEHHEGSGDDVRVLFNIGVTEVCQQAWRLAIGISRTRLWQIKSHFQDGIKAYLPPNHHRRGMQSAAVASAVMWLDRFSCRFGDKLPMQNKIHLPSCLTRATIYQLMKEEMEDLGEQVCSKVHFFRVWRKEMSHVTIPKVNRFSKCDVCTQLKQSMEKTNEKQARHALHQQREKHLTQQKTERMKYYKHAQKARRHPDKYISIILDGMDQKSTSIPKFYRTSKTVSAAWRLPSHITGTIVHGRGQHMFVDNKEYAHDSNMTANLLLMVLHKYAATLPDTLYLQMDNCGRENKNQCILGLCALLVELDVFKKVKLCFLMKGHTHEDVDQLFSRISTHTSKHNIPTLSSLLSHIPQSYNKPNTTAERVHTIFNIRDWIQTNINAPSNHSLPHQFKITKVNGKAVIHTKKWSNSSEWQSTTGCDHILSAHPPGIPDVVPRKVGELQLDRLQGHLPKYRPYLSDSEHQEWLDLIDSLKATDGCSDPAWILLDILMSKDTMTVDHTMEPLSDLILSNDEQDPIPPVNLGRKVTQKVRPSVPVIGDMVCVFLETHRNEWPQVGKVTSVQEKTAVLHWFTGTTTSKWTPLQTLDQPYTSTVSSSSFITGPFKLTGQGKLPLEIQRQLRNKQEALYNE